MEGMISVFNKMNRRYVDELFKIIFRWDAYSGPLVRILVSETGAPMVRIHPLDKVHSSPWMLRMRDKR